MVTVHIRVRMSHGRLNHELPMLKKLASRRL